MNNVFEINLLQLSKKIQTNGVNTLVTHYVQILYNQSSEFQNKSNHLRGITLYSNLLEEMFPMYYSYNDRNTFWPRHEVNPF